MHIAFSEHTSLRTVSARRNLAGRLQRYERTLSLEIPTVYYFTRKNPWPENLQNGRALDHTHYSQLLPLVRGVILAS